jgi:hypothetical protein
VAVDLLDQVEQMEAEQQQHRLMYAREGSGVRSLAEFEVRNLIGKGSISNVYLVERQAEPYAMKVIQKALVVG